MYATMHVHVHVCTLGLIIMYNVCTYMYNSDTCLVVRLIITICVGEMTAVIERIFQ